MKKIIFTFCLFIVSFISSRGQVSMFHEDFDGPGPYRAFDVPSTGQGWSLDATLYKSSPQSIHASVVAVNDTNILETDTFSDAFLGYGFITLTFSHIAKVDFFDRCIIQYSVDGGFTWIKLDNTNSSYNGSTAGAAATWSTYFSFMAPSYPIWQPGSPTLMPDSTWWVTESFDVTTALAFQFTYLKLRFVLYDDFNNGGAGNYGWNIDDIDVVGAFCELNPPYLAGNSTPAGIVYNGGPYNINYTALDSSGISYGYVVYTVMDSLGNVTGPDSVAMTNTGGSNWQGQIPAATLGDTICYYAYVVDASGCFNYTYVPSSGCTQFYYGNAVGFPFCSDFNIIPDTAWTVVTVSGSAWEQGTPHTPPITTTFEGSGCFDVDTANVYQSSTETYLYSPILGFANNIDVKLSFWQNRDVEDGWDGVVLQCDTNALGNWFDVETTQGVIPDPNGTNWYTTTNINSNQGHDAWDGSSGGWVYSELILKQLNNYSGPLQFRFVFTSDASVENVSFAIDKFCLKLPQLYDVGVFGFIEPAFETPAGSTQNVTVTIKNYGITPMNSGDFNVEYVINPGGITGSAPYAGATIAPNGTSTFLIGTFTVPTGQYQICANTSLVTDGDHTNDTLCNTFIGVPTFTPPYCDNFDTGTVYWSSVLGASGNTMWQLGTPNNGQLTTAHSAPNAWKTNLTSNYGDNGDAELRSPYFDFSTPATNNSVISFWMNRNIQANSDGLILEYTTNNGGTWTTLGVAGGPGTNWYNNTFVGPNFNGPGWDGTTGGWLRCDYEIAILNGTPSVRFRFHFESDFFQNAEGAAIDDFCVKPPVPNDAGVKRIISPTAQVNAGALLVPTVVIRNYGSNVLTSIPVSYRVNGAVTGNGTWTGSLNPGDSVQFNSWPAFTVPTCAFVFDAYTELLLEADFSNDTSLINSVGVQVLVLPTSGPTCDNFDSASCWVSIPSPNGNSKWELGTPNFGVTNSAHSAPNSWDVNLNSAYDNNAEAYLYTSKYDFTGAVNATLSFWHNFNTENNWDGVRIEYDLNGLGNWTILGTGPTDPNAENWYNFANLFSSNLPGWAGNSFNVFGTQWVKSSHNLSVLDGEPEVQFRFVFTSDGFGTVDGYSIDDFCIRTPFPHDLGVVKIIRPGPLEGIGSPLQPVVTIKNYGSNTETNSPVVMTQFSAPFTPITTLWTGSIAPNATVNVTLNVDTVPGATFSYCAWTELPLDGDLTNDTLCGTSQVVPVVDPTYTTNFDTGTTSFANVPGTVNAATNWELGTPNWGLTNSAHSAPNAWDVNLNITYAPNDSCFLYTPIFNLTNKKAPVLRFWHNRNLDNFNGDGVRCEYTIDGGTSWHLVTGPGFPTSLNWYNSNNIFSSDMPGWNGNSGGWLQSFSVLDTNIFDGSPGLQAQFRFIFTSDGFTQVDGFSIDDFELFIPTALSVAPQVIKSVNKLLTPGPQYMTVRVRNKGTNTVNTANVTLKVGPNVIVTDAVTFTPALSGATYAIPGSYAVHTFSLPWNAAPGVHDVCVYTDNPNLNVDQDQSDDTICVQLSVFDSVSVATGNPYCSDFESGPQWVVLNALTFTPPNNPNPLSWTLGTPAKACLNSVHSGVNAWSTEISANYPNRDTSALFTPVFNIDPLKCYKFTFWHKYDTEQFQDGGNVEFSNDSGNTWHLLGFGGEPNWYNSSFVTGLGGVPPSGGFSGTNCNWTQGYHEYQSPSGPTVIFRFRFGSDFSFNKEGWEVDDVCFEELTTPCFVGIDDPDAINGLALGQNHPNPANTTTTFGYFLPEQGAVTIEITDIMGQVVMTPVAEGIQGAGAHELTISTEKLTPGIYFYSLKFNDSRLVKKMVINK